MVDVADTPAADTPVVDTPTPELFGEDGNFTENWTHTLKNEALHDDPTLKTIRNMDALASITVNTKSMVGKDTIPVPTEASTELEWDEWHKAGGRPDTAADFNLTRPEELPEEYYNTELATAAQELFYKIGLSKKQADALFAFNNNNVVAQLTQKAQNDELEMTELKNGLYSEWGNAYEQKVHLGDIAMVKAATTKRGDEEIVDEEFKARLVKKTGNDPDIIRAFANLGAKFVDPKNVDTSQFIPTPADYQSQIDEIQANPLYLNGTQEQRMKLASQIMALREKMKPVVKTT